MKSWVDTTVKRKDTWLVLTIHGVDSIGWEALTHQALQEYFNYIKKREDKLWVATFGDVTKYMRERQAATVREQNSKEGKTVLLTHSLDKSWYNYPLTLKTYIPASWHRVKFVQGLKVIANLRPHQDAARILLYIGLSLMARVLSSQNLNDQ